MSKLVSTLIAYSVCLIVCLDKGLGPGTSVKSCFLLASLSLLTVCSEFCITQSSSKQLTSKVFPNGQDYTLPADKSGLQASIVTERYPLHVTCTCYFETETSPPLLVNASLHVQTLHQNKSMCRMSLRWDAIQLDRFRYLCLHWRLWNVFTFWCQGMISVEHQSSKVKYFCKPLAFKNVGECSFGKPQFTDGDSWALWVSTNDKTMSMNCIHTQVHAQNEYMIEQGEKSHLISQINWAGSIAWLWIYPLVSIIKQEIVEQTCLIHSTRRKERMLKWISLSNRKTIAAETSLPARLAFKCTSAPLNKVLCLDWDLPLTATWKM